MKRKSAARRRVEDLCAEPGADDGVAPKLFFRTHDRKDKSTGKARRLCGQIADTLNLVLSGECDDRLLQGLYVVAVRPAPDSSQLLVVVAPAVAAEPLDPRQVMDRLERASGRLRTEVAAAITRRRAPRLVFRFVDDPGSPEALR